MGGVSGGADFVENVRVAGRWPDVPPGSRQCRKEANGAALCGSVGVRQLFQILSDVVMYCRFRWHFDVQIFLTLNGARACT